MTDRDTTTRTRARAPGVGGVFHRMAVHDQVLRPNSERTTVATTKCTKGGCKLDGGRRMPGAGLSRRSPRKAPPGQSAFQPYWGKLAVRNDRGDRGNVGIIRSPIRASILPDPKTNSRPDQSHLVRCPNCRRRNQPKGALGSCSQTEGLSVKSRSRFTRPHARSQEHSFIGQRFSKSVPLEPKSERIICLPSGSNAGIRALVC